MRTNARVTAVMVAIAAAIAALIWQLGQTRPAPTNPGPVEPTTTGPTAQPTGPAPVTGTQSLSFNDLTLPPGLFQLAAPVTRSNAHGTASAGTWRTASPARQVVADLAAANPALSWAPATAGDAKGGSGLVGTSRTDGQVRQVEVDAVYSPDAAETLVRVVDTEFYVGVPVTPTPAPGAGTSTGSAAGPVG